MESIFGPLGKSTNDSLVTEAKATPNSTTAGASMGLSSLKNHGRLGAHEPQQWAKLGLSFQVPHVAVRMTSMGIVLRTEALCEPGGSAVHQKY